MSEEFESRKRLFLEPILFEAGAGLLDSQNFEYSVAFLLHLLAIKSGSDKAIDQSTKIMENEAKKTAGQLCNILRSQIDIDESLEKVLSAALTARNNLVHRYLTENLERAADGTNREELVKEIRVLRREIQAGHTSLALLIDRLSSGVLGIDLEAEERKAIDGFLKGTDA